MAKVYTCDCGMKTTEPYLIAGRLLCTMCAEEENPHIVNRRAAANWKEFTSTNRKVPTQSHRRNWQRIGDEER